MRLKERVVSDMGVKGRRKATEKDVLASQHHDGWDDVRWKRTR